MGSKSGLAHALGCPEWVPPGVGSGEGVLGTLWWFQCPSGPILAIHADTDQICLDTYRYIQIPTYTYILETAKYRWRQHTERYKQIATDTYRYMHIPTPKNIPTHTFIYIQYLPNTYMLIPTDTYVDP